MDILKQELVILKESSKGTSSEESQKIRELERELVDVKVNKELTNLKLEIRQKTDEIANMENQLKQQEKELVLQHDQRLQAVQQKHKEEKDQLYKALEDKQRELDFQTKTKDETVQNMKREEELIMSAFYELAVELNKSKRSSTTHSSYIDVQRNEAYTHGYTTGILK